VQKFDIIIGGGGSIGLACALSLVHTNRKNPLSVLILDRGKALDKIDHNFDGRNIALNNASIRLLDNIGRWVHIKDNCQPISDIIVSDGTLKYGASENPIHFDANDINEGSFGHFALNPNIHQTLINAIKSEPNITLCYEAHITNIQHNDESVTVTDHNNVSYQASLLIAADGKNSFIRNHHNIDVTQKEYGQTAIVLAVSHEKPHHGIAQEFFLPTGPFAILPLTGNQTSLVWVQNHKMAKALLNAPSDVFAYELQRRFGDYLGALTITSKKFSYPLIRQIAKQITAPRTVFIGDAAHIIHPIAGQGFNLGLRDVGFLCDLVAQHHYAGLDIGGQVLLSAYEKSRKNDIQLLGNVTNAINGLFSNDYMLLQQSRRFGLNIVNQIPPLRNFFSKGASEGSIAPLPSLLA
jgi:2-octaprenyl-6-methoxyphenol hydroxylase